MNSKAPKPNQSKFRPVSAPSQQSTFSDTKHPTAILQSDPSQWSPAEVLQLQQTIGNRAVGQLLSKSSPPSNAPIQGKFITGTKLIQHPATPEQGPRQETITIFIDQKTKDEYVFVNKGVHPELGEFYVLKRIKDEFITRVQISTGKAILESNKERARRLNEAEMDTSETYETLVHDESPLPDNDEVEMDVQIENKSTLTKEPKGAAKKAKKLLSNDEINERVNSKLNTEFLAQVSLVPDSSGVASDPSSGLKGEPHYKANQLWVEDLQIGDKDRPDTRFDNQRSHTVAWTLLRAEIASLRGLPLSNVFTIIFERFAELNAIAEALKLNYNVESKRSKSKVAVDKVEKAMIEMLTVKLGQAAIIAQPILTGEALAPLYHWQKVISQLVRLFTQTYQLSKGASMSDGSADGDAEADGMAKLRKHESALKTTGDYGEPTPPKGEQPLTGSARTQAAIAEIVIAAERLLDINFKASLPPQGYAQSVKHWIQALYLAFPTVMKKVGDTVLKNNLERAPKGAAAKTGAPTVQSLIDYYGYGDVDNTRQKALAIAETPRLKNSDVSSLRKAVPAEMKSAFTANVSVAPLAAGSSIRQLPPQPLRPPTFAPAQSTIVLPDDKSQSASTPFYTASQIAISKLAISDQDRPKTRYEGDQKSHTVAWTLMRAELRSFANKPISDLLLMIQGEIGHIKPFVKHAGAAQMLQEMETQLAGATTDSLPIHGWQVFGSDIVRRYMIIYQRSHSTTFADTSTLGAAWGHGEAEHMKVLRNNEQSLGTDGVWKNTDDRVIEAAIKLIDIHPDSALSKEAALEALRHWEGALLKTFPIIMSQRKDAILLKALDRQLGDDLVKKYGHKTLRAWLYS